MTYGPNPWLQTQWDWRAAANFICGGAGSGMIVLAALAGAPGLARSVALLGGVMLVGVGLLCVWLEIGRPFRALHVFINPRTSWMSREAIVAAVLMPVVAAGTAGLADLDALAALLAIAFVFCQSRILHAAKGIPAWREPLLTPLIVLTGIAEGGGLWLLVQPVQAAGQPLLLGLIGGIVLARALVWHYYLRRLANCAAAARARGAFDRCGRWLMLAGSLVPLLLLALVATGLAGPGLAAPLLAAAGCLAAVTGVWVKFVLITRASFNQGFALKALPVRGVRH